jgi:hypothetical protein
MPIDHRRDGGEERPSLAAHDISSSSSNLARTRGSIFGLFDIGSSSLVGSCDLAIAKELITSAVTVPR